MLAEAVAWARAAGRGSVAASYSPTKKNGPCLAFFEQQSGFQATGHRFEWALTRDYPVPTAVTVHRHSAGSVEAS